MSDNKASIPQDELGDFVKYENDDISKSTQIDSRINISSESEGQHMNFVPVSSKPEGTQFFIEVDASTAANLSSENHYTFISVDHQIDIPSDQKEGNFNSKENCICIVDNSGMEWSGKVSYLKTQATEQDSSVKQNPITALTNLDQSSLNHKNSNEQVIMNPQLDKENIFNGRSTFATGSTSQSKSFMNPPQNTNAMPVRNSRYGFSSGHFHPYIPGQLLRPQYQSTPAACKNILYSSSSSDDVTDISSVSSSSIDLERSVDNDNLIPLNNATLPKHNDDALMTDNKATID